MAEKEYYVTKEKYEELKEELDYLTNTRRTEIAKDLEHARSMGDLSENAEYDEARQQQASTEDRIREIKEILQHAEIVEPSKSDTVEIGSTVTLKKKGADTEKEFTITGSEEADMTAGKISYTSPLGSAVMKKKKGETFTFEAPGGEITYKVVDIQ